MKKVTLLCKLYNVSEFESNLLYCLKVYLVYMLFTDYECINKNEWKSTFNCKPIALDM